MHWALNQLSDVAPAWVQRHLRPEWYPRYGLRSDQTRLPKDASKREALARQVGADGYQLLESVRLPESPPGVCALPALEALRQIWLQQYYRCTVPRWEALRWRTEDEQPPQRCASLLPTTWRPATAVNATPIGWAIRFTSPRLVTQASAI